MSRPNELLDRGRSFARIWAEFIQAYQKDPSRLYCFFEGVDDPKYYNPRIKSVVFQNEEVNLENFWCEGKQNVIKVFSLITNDIRYEKAWVAFFIDKDFDNIEDLPNDRRAFITPCYAVENLYISQRVIEQILRDEFSISETSEDFQPTIDLFNDMLERFNVATEELNVWLYLQRRLEKKTENKSKVHINNLTNNQLFTIQINKVTKKYTLAKLAESFPEAPIISQHEITFQIAEFRKIGRTLNFRGKYLIFFLQRFLMCLVEDRRQKKNQLHFKNRGQVKLQLSNNIISELSQYADTPESLREFLIKISNGNKKQLELEI